MTTVELNPLSETRHKPLFCVSDLHLGDRGPRDCFNVKNREERFMAFLDHVESCNGRLVILGDLFDWWQVAMGASAKATTSQSTVGARRKTAR
jgi:UDP-2,3-diacylglucosamine pyrophosphatase LpxH